MPRTSRLVSCSFDSSGGGGGGGREGGGKGGEGGEGGKGDFALSFQK